MNKYSITIIAVLLAIIVYLLMNFSYFDSPKTDEIINANFRNQSEILAGINRLSIYAEPRPIFGKNYTIDHVRHGSCDIDLIWIKVGSGFGGKLLVIVTNTGAKSFEFKKPLSEITKLIIDNGESHIRYKSDGVMHLMGGESSILYFEINGEEISGKSNFKIMVDMEYENKKYEKDFQFLYLLKNNP